MRRLVVLSFIFLFIVCLPGVAGALIINFDDTAVTGSFLTEGPLRDQYAKQGVRFLGQEENDGGARLNAEAANFGIQAYQNSANFLAFNRKADYKGGGTAQWPEFIVFDDLWKTVSIYVSSIVGNDKFILRAYDINGKMVDEESIESKVVWVPISVEWAFGIQKVELTRFENGSATFAADSLELTERVNRVPEPGTMLLLGLGLIGVGVLRKRN